MSLQETHGDNSYAQYEKEVDDFFSRQGRTYVNCIFCGPALNVLIFEKGPLQIRRCQCGLVYNATPPDNIALERFYDKSDALKQWSEIKGSFHEHKRQKNKFFTIVERIAENLSIKSVLDLGCGNGYFLKYLKSLRPDIKIKGIETNLSAINICRNNNIPVENSDIIDFLLNDTYRYDYITMWGVLEHVKDPLKVMRLVRKKLNYGGFVTACVPNVNSEVVQRLWKDCFTFCPQHLWYFSPATLNRLFYEVELKYRDHFTIESEVLPVIKHSYGLHPYSEIPSFLSHLFTKEMVSLKEEQILSQDKGYKVILTGCNE